MHVVPPVLVLAFACRSNEEPCSINKETQVREKLGLIILISIPQHLAEDLVY
jgi:hypothetical protein